MSLFAGIIGQGAALAFQSVLARLVALPPEQQRTGVPQIPASTMLALVLVGALVAGIAEEAGFRGYMQGMIEQRHGPAVAILVSGIVFGLSHFLHRQVGFGHLPFYLAVSAVYGMLTSLTGSIMPGVVLHAAGNMLDGFLLVLSGQSSWTSAPKALVWESGPDKSFWALSAWAALCAPSWPIGALPMRWKIIDLFASNALRKRLYNCYGKPDGKIQA
jgi:membrane protease YdiL (CAAX protease family)